MNNSRIFVNLAVTDLKRSTEFFGRLAAIGLALVLIAISPANVRAVRERIPVGGNPATPLVARSFIQGVFLTATIAAAIASNG